MYAGEILLSAQKPPQVLLEFERAGKQGVYRVSRLCKAGDDLFKLSASAPLPGLEEYRGYVLEEIDPYNNCVLFANGVQAYVGQLQGDASEESLRRIQIRETILSHLEKEQALFEQGIKTLSLFFIDEVKNYRQYAPDGTPVLGRWGRIFEEEYQRVLEQLAPSLKPAYRDYLNRIPVFKTHNGYFSIDKQGRSVNSATRRGSADSDDASAYDLILKDKERLLSFEEPTRFIFSHSALREGWDNPNIFQICTLKHSTDNATQKRQEVGRGLRLCVNRQGIRQDASLLKEAVHQVNRLTVVTEEGYASFVADLQSDIKQSLCNRPTEANEDYFFGKTLTDEHGQSLLVDKHAARSIHRCLIRKEYIDDNDQVTDLYRQHAAENTLEPLPGQLAPYSASIYRLLQAVFDERVLQNMMQDGKESKIETNQLNQNFASFAPMWELIRQQFAYTVSFSSQALVDACIRALNSNLRIAKVQYHIAKGEQKTTMDPSVLQCLEAFTSAKTRSGLIALLPEFQPQYDLLGKLAQGTALTRKSVAAILQGISPQAFEKFSQNPEQFISQAISLILEQKALLISQTIAYTPIQGAFSQEIFQSRQPVGHSRALKTHKHITDYIVMDSSIQSSVEARFALDLEGAEEVLCYAKLPRRFFIPTPVGRYTPDWAVVLREGVAAMRLFLVETKGSLQQSQRRFVEEAKIACATALCSQQLPQVHFCVQNDFKSFKDYVLSM